MASETRKSTRPETRVADGFPTQSVSEIQAAFDAEMEKMDELFKRAQSILDSWHV